jgi:hypothetical protein
VHEEHFVSSALLAWSREETLAAPAFSQDEKTMARAAVVAQQLETLAAFGSPYRLPPACARSLLVRDIEHLSRLPRQR